jgi:S-adenosylmethionine:tRNA ribosyltransferase-isomerase
MNPKELPISEFTYDLPPDRIARYPLEERDSSKLLVFKSGRICQSTYKNLYEFLPKGTLLVFNNTRVVEARLLFQKPTGGVIEIFCLEPADRYADLTSAMMEKGTVVWKCLVGGASKWKHGVRLQKIMYQNSVELVLEASITGRIADSFEITLNWQPTDLSFAEVLHFAGQVPLPPYLHREADESDKSRYQTIYASADGSVAAPTAGLHFTDTIFEKLAAKDIQTRFVTLHVGAGTFKPVKAEKMEEHEMHPEFIDVSVETILDILNCQGKPVVAVGTTSLRTMESLYWMGLKVIKDPDLAANELTVKQWEPYETQQQEVTTEESLKSLLSWMTRKEIKSIVAKTQVLIAPGYRLRVATGIITNFHQPQSTLLLLVSAIVGEAWREIYQYALNNDFRFLSYGDGCLLWKE